MLWLGFTQVLPGQHAPSRRPTRAMVTMGEPVVTLGTRGSPLALAQAYETKKRLAEAFPDELGDESAVEIKVIKTTGDLVLNKALAEMGGKGLFTKELDVQLLNEEVDICVHSMKTCRRGSCQTRSCPAICRGRTRVMRGSRPTLRGRAISRTAGVGTASLRRQARLAKCAPPGLALPPAPPGDCPYLSLSPSPLLPPPPPAPLRPSSRPPCRAHAIPALLPAAQETHAQVRQLPRQCPDAAQEAGGGGRCDSARKAGLNRMGMTEHITNILEWDTMLPAVAQGAIGIQCREGDERIMRFLDALTDKPTKIAVDCERAFLAALDGNCRTPIAGQAKIVDGQVFFQGLIAKPDGSLIFETTKTAAPEDAVKMGTEAGEELKAKCGARFEEFFTEMEVAPEPVSSMSGKTTDGLGGYKDECA